jgi:hypothetical protein
MTTARTIITLALEGMNKLSPGETLDADLAAACLRRLNAIADDDSVGRSMMPQDVIVSGAVTGPSLTLGAGLFAAVAPGTEIIAAQADRWELSPITMAQYASVEPSTGRPEVFAADGLATVYLYPAAVGHTISLLVRKAFAQFADLDTDYLMPAGYQGMFAASLAVAMAPALLGGVPPALYAAEKRAKYNVQLANVRPAIINADPMRACVGNIFNGWR